MTVKVSDLDKSVKTKLRDEIQSRILKKNKSLPLPDEVDKITNVLTANTVEALESIIKEYYREFFEPDSIAVGISVEDYVDIYLNRI